MTHHCHCSFHRLRERLTGKNAKRLGLLGAFLVVAHLLFHVIELLIIPALFLAAGQVADPSAMASEPEDEATTIAPITTNEPNDENATTSELEDDTADCATVTGEREDDTADYTTTTTSEPEDDTTTATPTITNEPGNDASPAISLCDQ